MEIHRRSRQPPAKPSTPQTNGRRTALNLPPRRPSATTTTDSFLLRLSQFISLLVLFWFSYLVVSVNRAASNDGIRGSNVIQPLKRDERPLDVTSTRKLIESIRSEFHSRYGGESEALAMLHRGLKTFGSSSGGLSSSSFSVSSLRGTAHCLLSARIDRGRFVLSFGGYSVTVGTYFLISAGVADTEE